MTTAATALAVTERGMVANPVHTTGTTAGGPRRGSLRPVVGVLWLEAQSRSRGSHLCRIQPAAARRSWLQARPSGRLAGIVCVLAIGNAGLGGPELAVARPSAAEMRVVALALAVTSLLAPASRTAPCRDRVRADLCRMQGLHEPRITHILT